MGKKKKSTVLIMAMCIVMGAGFGFRPAVAAEDAAAPTMTADTGQSAGEGTGEVRVSSFATREEAEKFVQKIGAGGYETVIRKERTEDNRTIYSVFIMVHGDQPKESLQLPVAGESGKIPGEEMPVGTTNSLSGIFGGRSLFHASLALTELFTDNAYLSNQNRRSGSSTVLSPEVWVLLPRTELRLPEIEEISTRAPGGLILSRGKPEVSRRYEAFLLYHADIPLHSSLPSAKTVSHRVAGGFIYNGNRVLAGVMDQFDRSYDVVGTGVPSDPVRVDKYKSNLFDASVSYDTMNRVRLMLDYSNFLLRYDDPSNDFQNRIDNGVAGYVFYQIQPKTALFVEYDFIDIAHDKDKTLDSREHNIFGGVQWDITAKSKGILKAGYGIKDFVNVDTNAKNYIFEAQITHHLSSKNSLNLDAYRKTDETDFLQAAYTVTDGVKAEYLHRLTVRLTASAGLGYARETYKGGDFTLDGVTKQRKDNVYDATLSLRYQFKRWLESDIGYEFTDRDSNFSDFSYRSNTMFFRIRGAI
jgi:polysaccharide biosynthesis protein VpsM